MTPNTQTVTCSREETVRSRWNETFQHFKIHFSQKNSFQEKRMMF